MYTAAVDDDVYAKWWIFYDQFSRAFEKVLSFNKLLDIEICNNYGRLLREDF
jgi:hypothetical protein